MQTKSFTINGVTVNMQGDYDKIRSLIDKIKDNTDVRGLPTYQSNTRGEIMIWEMDTRHIKNTVIKKFRESRHPSVTTFRSMLSRFVMEGSTLDAYLLSLENSHLAYALSVVLIDPEFSNLVYELGRREDE